MLRRSPLPVYLTIVEVEFSDGGRDQYFLPLTACTRADAMSLEDRAPQAIVANITGAKKGYLFDAWLDDRSARTLLDAMEREEQITTKRGAIRASKTRGFAGIRGGSGGDPQIHRPSAEQATPHGLAAPRSFLQVSGYRTSSIASASCCRSCPGRARPRSGPASSASRPSGTRRPAAGAPRRASG